MGHGFKMAPPVIGKILTELVVDGETNEVDLKHFSIGRFNKNSKH
jgi:sarcosine oxidase/L-pipecolate oxidase